MGFLSALLAVLAAVVSVTAGPDYWLGGSVYTGALHDNLALIGNTSSNAGRVEMCWKYLLPYGRVPSVINASMTVAYARAHPAVVDAFLNASDLQAGFATMDSWIATLNASGVRTIGTLGDGGTNCIPSYPNAQSLFDPNVVGEELYRAYMYIFARAMARRFGDRVAVWQIENEPNYAWVTAIAGERVSKLGGNGVGGSTLAAGEAVRALLRRAGHDAERADVVADAVARAPALAHVLARAGLALPGSRASKTARTDVGRDPTGPGAGAADFAPSWLIPIVGSWANATFVGSVLAVLHEAIVTERPTARCVLNYLTDVPQSFSELAGMPHWTDLVAAWINVTDVLALDAYPNFLYATPVQGVEVGARVAEAVALVRPLKPEAPVWIMETGYGVLHNDTAATISVVPGANFSEVNQRQYHVDAFTSALANGATGYLNFGLWKDEGIPAPPGGYSSVDEDAIVASSALYINGTSAIGGLVDFVLGHLDYAVTRMGPVLFNVTAHFGTFIVNATTGAQQPLLAAVELEALYQSVLGTDNASRPL